MNSNLRLTVRGFPEISYVSLEDLLSHCASYFIPSLPSYVSNSLLFLHFQRVTPSHAGGRRGRRQRQPGVWRGKPGPAGCRGLPAWAPQYGCYFRCRPRSSGCRAGPALFGAGWRPVVPGPKAGKPTMRIVSYSRGSAVGLGAACSGRWDKRTGGSGGCWGVEWPGCLGRAENRELKGDWRRGWAGVAWVGGRNGITGPQGGWAGLGLRMARRGWKRF